jgi:hypothetical protein
MARVLVLNNYPLDEVQDEIRRKEKPDHHLYGINYFANRGYEVDIAKFVVERGLGSCISPIMPVGNLDAQLAVLKNVDRFDLIYAPCQTHSGLLAILKTLSCIKTPIVAIAHHPLDYGRLAWIRKPANSLIVRGTAAFPSLSMAVSKQINLLAGKNVSRTLAWGPDADYYPTSNPLGEGVVAAGRTGRDFVTFGRGASLSAVPAKILCVETDASPEFADFAKNVDVRLIPAKRLMTYPQLIEVFSQARVLAIPLPASATLLGLTSLTDALALGKPVIMTRNPFIDLDIEQLGIGKWVAPGDVTGWREAIEYYSENNDAAYDAGKRARELVDRGLNSKTFADDVIEIFDSVIH